MSSVGNVRIGSRNIDIQAFTGEVMDTAYTTYVNTTTNQNGYSRTSTSHYNKFLLANGSGRHAIEVSERVISIARGQKVTGFWGVVRGKDSPPLNQLLTIVAVFAGVFGVFALFGSPGPGAVMVALSAVILWRVQRRRKTLMHAVGAALTAVRMEA